MTVPNRALLALACCVLLSACPKSADVEGYAGIDADLETELRNVGLGPGDVFKVTVYGEKDLSASYQVDPSGTINFPLIGRVSVDGMTPGQIATMLRDKLADGYLREPNVSVFVEKYNSKKIFVLGQVRKPGTFPYTAGMSVVEAITLAGGFSGTANQNFVVITRKENGVEKVIPVPVGDIAEGEAPNIALRTGDIVFVPDKLL